jgi:hypothetical protein
MSGDPFPVDALEANRRGRLTPAQMRELGRAAQQTGRTGVRVGLVLIGFGAVLLLGALTGMIGSRLGPLALGAVLIVGGIGLLTAGGLGRGGRASQRAGGGDDRVEIVRGYLRRQDSARGIADQALGLRPSPSPDAERDHYLHVGDRRFAVREDQFHAAPTDGLVQAYVLPGSDVLVNLERVGPGRGEVIGKAVAAGMGAPSPAPNPWPAPPPPAQQPLQQAVVGRWWHPGLGLVLELHADGVALSGRGQDLERSRWRISGVDVLEYGGETFRVRPAPGQLELTDVEGSSLTFRSY